MDIKDLNRSQFILLLLLLMFISSITTAIVTVTLMDQSPRAGMANTINRVIERVVPGATTTVVKIIKETPNSTEGQQIVKAMETLSPTVVRLNQKTEKGNVILGTGFIVRPDLAVTSLKNVAGEAKEVLVEKGDLLWPAEIVKRDADNNIAFVKFNATSTLAGVNLTYGPTPASGETSVALAYSDSSGSEVTTGIVMGSIKTTATSTPNVSIEVIRTGAVVSDNVGGPLINTKGEIIGIGISRGYALAGSALKLLIDQIK